MPLTMLNAGESRVIRKIGGGDDKKRFLSDLGFMEGEKVTVISEISGNVIINVKGSRIALDKNMAGKIFVQ